jgi:hypothetical protein
MPQLWPESLPQQFDKEGYQDSFADNRLMTNPELGPSLIRSRYSSMSRKLGGVMKMNKSQLNTLRNFWKVSTLDGKLPFNFPDPIFGYGGRRNWIPNSTNSGATVGNPGTLPTGWASLGAQNGIVKTVLDVGYEGSLSYIDIRFAGIPTGSAYADIYFNSPPVVAHSGERWSGAIYSRLIGGDITTIKILRLYAYTSPDSSGTGVAYKDFQTELNVDPLATQRYVAEGVVAPVGTTGATLRFNIFGVEGQEINVIIRFAGPQLEKSAHITSYMQTPNTANPIARFGQVPPQPSFIGGQTWAVNMQLEIFET